MGGQWTASDVLSPATRPGAYFNVIAQAADLLEAGDRGVVLIVGRANWGPVDETVELLSEADVTRAYGTGSSLPKLATQAIRGGAATVLGLRIAGSSAAVATATLDDEYDVADALTFEALYPGTRANSFTITVSDHPVEGLLLDLKESGVLLERYHTVSGLAEDFAILINAESAYVVADGSGGGVLAIVTDAPFASGNSGTTVVSGDYTAAQTVAEGEIFDVYVQDDDTNGSNQNAVAAWTETRREAGQLFMTVMGGAAAELVSTAMTRAGDFDFEGVVYVYPGFTDADGVVFTGQEAAARVAGHIAAAGFSRSVTFQVLDGVADVETRLGTQDVASALEAGVLLIVADGPEVRIEKGINTFTSEAEDETKSKAFRKIRTIATIDAVVEGLERGFRAYIGAVTNDDDGRQSMIGAGQEFLDRLVQARALNPGASVALDPSNPPTVDQVFLVVAITPLDSVEQIFVTVNVAT